MTKRYTLGVDPGAHGALALYANPTDVVVFDMPAHKITVGKSQKTRVDLYELGRILDLYGDSISGAVIEDVHSMPEQGVASSFAFGFAAGAVQGAIASSFIPMRLVRPAQWKKAMGCTADKDSSRRAASQLLPAHCSKWARKKDDGRAEAVLLAVYGSRLVTA